jgi:hypothetical protein
MTDVQRIRPVNREMLDSLEQDIQASLKRQQIGQAVEHVGEEDVGRLSGEAVMSLYEKAAKSIETMGTEMKVRIKSLEAALVESEDAMKAVVELAATIREKGKLHEVKIEEATLLSKEIRDACADFTKKVGA